MNVALPPEKLRQRLPKEADWQSLPAHPAADIGPADGVPKSEITQEEHQ